MGLQIDGGPIKAWLADGPDDRAVPLLDWLEEKAEEHHGNRFLAHKQRTWPNDELEVSIVVYDDRSE